MELIEQDDDSSPTEEEHAQQALQIRAQRNFEAVMAFEQDMFNWRSRHLILILTLNYKKELRGQVTLDDLRRDRDTLWNNVRSNPLLQGIYGYVWKIEEGTSGGGLHMHVVIFYDGHSRLDIPIANSIGKYWVEVVTRGRGDFWNSNLYKEQFEKNGWGNATGQVDRHDGLKRSVLQHYLGYYMAKDVQQVASRVNPHCRMFGTSRVPQKQGWKK